MESLLAPVKCIVQERKPDLDVSIVRKDRRIEYKVAPRSAMEVKEEMKHWGCPSSKVRKLIVSTIAYQSRPNTANASPTSFPRYTSTPVKGRAPSSAPPARRAPMPPSPSQRAPSAQSYASSSRSQTAPGMRSTGTQTSLERAASAGLVREKPPAPANRPASSRSSHSSAYNARTCRPSHMYMNEHLRQSAKLNRPPSHVHSCDEYRDHERSTRTPRSLRRWDGTEVALPNFMKGNEFLTHDKLDIGQKQYIWGIARIYSVSHLMQLKQRQYQSLLDYEFNRRLQNNELTERQRAHEMREYMRYTRFIKRYDQRIPRAKQASSAPTPCEEVSHIHRHVIKGWTTNPRSNDAYRGDLERDQKEVRDLPDYSDSSPDNSPDRPQRRTHIVTVIKGVDDDKDTEETETGHARPGSPDKSPQEDHLTGSGRNSIAGDHLSDAEENYL
ncbi:predicted protein [Nematostella vectensis]|uniref:Uncharacterized protein n=1 Tax=Nematostella vectensis TaxID=45351 RepID=A7RSU4_NEMVE|nr:predicted protein [Nematostella vectensis]|eukprot:XP_001637541.1 predicted protein [Nematostella vectensis]